MGFSSEEYPQLANSSTLQLHPRQNGTVRMLQSSDIPVFLSYGVIALVGCVSNSLTIAVMAKNTSLHTLYNYLLLNLAVVDLIASVFSIAKCVIILSVNDYGLSDLSATLICRFFTTVIYFSIVLSVATLTAISVERYFGIVKPLIHRNMTPKRLKYFLLFVWCAFLAGPAMISGELRMDETSYYCFFSAEEKDWPEWKLILGWFALAFVFILPLIVITTVYVKVIRHLRLRNRESNEMLGGTAESARLAARKTAKMVRLLVLITLLFAIAVLPELIYFAMIFYDRKYVNAALFYKVGIPTVAIIAINPLVYTLSNPTFRIAVQQLFHRPRRRQVVPRMAQTSKTNSTQLTI